MDILGHLRRTTQLYFEALEEIERLKAQLEAQRVTRTTHLVQSDALEGVSYAITTDSDGKRACSCPAYRFNKAVVKDCRHLRFLARNGR